MSDILIDVVSNLGALGIVLWLVIRFSNHTIPRLAKTFEKALGDARSDFKEALASQRTDFLKFAEDQKDFFDKKSEEQRDFFDTRIEAEHVLVDKIALLVEKIGLQREH